MAAACSRASAVAITTPTATVTAGSPATYDMALTGNNGYNGTVTFSCSGLPAHAACSFAPSSIVCQRRCSVRSRFTITTTAATASLTQPALPNSKPAAPSLWASLGGLGIFGLVLAAETKKRNRRNMAIVLGHSARGDDLRSGGLWFELKLNSARADRLELRRALTPS